MATINSQGQTCLEINAIEERQDEIKRNDYNSSNEYKAGHKDAVSDGDPQGKGLEGGHSHGFSLPDCTMPKNIISYKNFPTDLAGGQYDLEGRNSRGGYNRSMTRSLYNKENPYGAELVNTSENVAQGQYRFGETMKK